MITEKMLTDALLDLEQNRHRNHVELKLPIAKELYQLAVKGIKAAEISEEEIKEIARKLYPAINDFVFSSEAEVFTEGAKWAIQRMKGEL